MIEAYDERRLSRTPLGAFTERDGRLVRHHNGTHVTIEHAGAVTGDLKALVERQKSIAAERIEPVEWRELTACAKPGELIFWADPHHLGIAGDLRRVGGPGRPEWDEPVVGDGDLAVNAPFDLRFGSFGQHHEDSLCVWGADLLAQVSDELDALMPRLRTGGKKK